MYNRENIDPMFIGLHVHHRSVRMLKTHQGQLTRGDHGVPTIMLEVVVSNDLWFWHAFFGMMGSNNDLNVLGVSLIFNDTLQSKALDLSYVVNGHE